MYIAVILGSIYYVNFGFHPVLVPVIALIAAKPFTGGARQGLVECAVMVILPFFITRRETNYRRKKLTDKINKKRKVIMILAGTAMVALLLFVSNQRSNYAVNTSFNNYASPVFLPVIKRVPGLYQIYSYFCSPLGVLNEFLKDPTFNFGANTLMPFYNILNRLGLNIPVQRYQPFYYIPIHINVGTAVRELIEDYSVVGFVIILFSGYCVGSSYKKYQTTKSTRSLFVLSFLYFLAVMSWFVWFLRDANLIIALFFGCIICDRIDKYEIVKENDEAFQ